MWKLEFDTNVCTSKFPARQVGKNSLDGAGSWVVAYQEENFRRYKKPLDPIKPKKTKKITNVLSYDLLQKNTRFDNPNDLCSIDVSGKDLTEVDSSNLENFKSVAYINAAENRLQLDSFQRFPILRELELPMNGIKNIKLQPGVLESLQVLDLSYNDLIPSSLILLGVLPSLKVLSLTGNRLMNIPVELATCIERNEFSMLEVLFLGENVLSSCSTFYALSTFPNLRELHLEDNLLCSIPNIKINERAEAYEEGTTLPIPPHNSMKADDVEMSRAMRDSEINITVVDSEDATSHQATPIPRSPTIPNPPFQNLRYLGIANNKMEVEGDVLPVAGWPMLRHIDLYGNPIVEKTSGEPPLLSSVLRDRLGICIQRRQPSSGDRKVKKRSFIINNDRSRKVSDHVARIPKQSVDVLINMFRQPILPDIEVREQIISDPQATQPPSDTEHADQHKATSTLEGDPVFLTQVDEDEVEVASSRSNASRQAILRTETSHSCRSAAVVQPQTDKRFEGYEILLDVKPDENFTEPVGLQNNVQALRRMLNRGAAIQPSITTSQQQQQTATHAYEAKPSKTWHKMQVSLHPSAAPTRRQRLDKALDRMRTDGGDGVVTMELTKALDSKEVKRNEAKLLLNQVQEKYSGLNNRRKNQAEDLKITFKQVKDLLAK